MYGFFNGNLIFCLKTIFNRRKNASIFNIESGIRKFDLVGILSERGGRIYSTQNKKFIL